MEIDDFSIVQELKRGSNSGCRLLVEKYQDFLYNWGLKHYKELDAYALWELIDDTFLKVIKNIDFFEPKSENAFRNWIFSIFRNQIIDYLKAERRKSKYITFHSIDDDPFDDDETGLSPAQIELNRMIYQDYLNPAESVVHPLAEKVKEFVESLEENNRIILLGCANGYTHKEIAEWTGIREKNIKVYYSRLKKKLENLLLSEVSGKDANDR